MTRGDIDGHLQVTTARGGRGNTARKQTGMARNGFGTRTETATERRDTAGTKTGTGTGTGTIERKEDGRRKDLTGTGQSRSLRWGTNSCLILKCLFVDCVVSALTLDHPVMYGDMLFH